jgi:hypothetical protein
MVSVAFDAPPDFALAMVAVLRRQAAVSGPVYPPAALYYLAVQQKMH